MTLQRAGRLAWSSCATCVALTATGLAFLAVNDGTLHANPLGSPALDAAFGVVFLSFPLVGALIASRQPRNPIGWLFLGTGFALGLQRALLGWSTHELVVGPGTSSAAALAALVADLLWVPTLVGGIAMLFLLFPGGCRHPAGGRRSGSVPPTPPLTWLARRSSPARSTTSLRRTTR